MGPGSGLEITQGQTSRACIPVPDRCNASWDPPAAGGSGLRFAKVKRNTCEASQTRRTCAGRRPPRMQSRNLPALGPRSPMAPPKSKSYENRKVWNSVFPSGRGVGNERNKQNP